MDICFLDIRLVRAMHAELIAEHGGSLGVRDDGLLKSAFARPLNLAAYGNPTIPTLAAAYAFGIARNHPFIDGNKRVAFVCMAVFLELNGWELQAAQGDATYAMLRLAASEITEADLVTWIDHNAVWTGEDHETVV